MPRPAPLMRSQRLERRPSGRRVGEGHREPGVAGSHAAICQGNDIQLTARSQANNRMTVWPHPPARARDTADDHSAEERPASLPSPAACGSWSHSPLAQSSSSRSSRTPLSVIPCARAQPRKRSHRPSRSSSGPDPGRDGDCCRQPRHATRHAWARASTCATAPPSVHSRRPDTSVRRPAQVGTQ